MTFRSFALRTLFLVTLGVSLALLWTFRNTWMLVFLALVIAVGVSIPVSYLRRLRMPRALAVALSLAGTVLIALGLGFWLIPSIVADFAQLIQGLPAILNRLTQLYTQFRSDDSWASAILPPLNQQVDSSTFSPERLRELLSGALNVGLPVLVSGGSLIGTLLANLFLVVMLVIFFLAEPRAYLQGLLYLVPEGRQGQFLGLVSVLYHTLRTWLSTLLISISITVTLVLVILGALGMPNVFVVSVFAGLATFVPNIGAILPVIPIVVFTLVDDPSKMPVMVAAYLAIQLLESNVLTPSIVRRQLSIPPAATLVTQILAASIFGVLGILLAVPLLASLITTVRELYSYNLLGLRGRKLRVVLPDPTPHARDVRLQQRASAVQQRLQQQRLKRLKKLSDGKTPHD